MKRIILLLLVVLACAYSQETVEPGTSHEGAAHAEAAVDHGEGHGEQPMANEIWWKWANFAILAVLLWWIGGKHIGPYFRSRTESIQKGIVEASAMRADAEARAAEIERRLSHLGPEIESMREESQREIAAEDERMRAETEQQLNKILVRAEADIAAATKHARDDLKAYAAQLAVSIASQQLRNRMDGGTQERLTEEFIEDLRKKAAVN